MKNIKTVTRLAVLSSLLLAVILATGCNKAEQDFTGTASSGEREYDRVCIDGVEYLYKSLGYGKMLAPHFKPDGALYVCS